MASTNFIPGQLTIRGCEIASNKEVEFAVEELLFTIQSLYRTQARKRLSVVCHSVTVLSVGGTGTPEEEEGTSSTKTLQVQLNFNSENESTRRTDMETLCNALFSVYLKFPIPFDNLSKFGILGFSASDVDGPFRTIWNRCAITPLSISKKLVTLVREGSALMASKDEPQATVGNFLILTAKKNASLLSNLLSVTLGAVLRPDQRLVEGDVFAISIEAKRFMDEWVARHTLEGENLANAVAAMNNLVAHMHSVTAALEESIDDPSVEHFELIYKLYLATIDAIPQLNALHSGLASTMIESLCWTTASAGVLTGTVIWNGLNQFVPGLNQSTSARNTANGLMAGSLGTMTYTYVDGEKKRDRMRVLRLLFDQLTDLLFMVFELTESDGTKRLAMMALNILSVATMSDEPERIFSAAEITMSSRRTSLSEESLEATECLKAWERAGLSTSINGGTVTLAEVERMIREIRKMDGSM